MTEAWETYIAALEKRVAELEQLLACKNEALGVFADNCSWEWNHDSWIWNGVGDYENPVAFAYREQARTAPTDTISDISHTMTQGITMMTKTEAMKLIGEVVAAFQHGSAMDEFQAVGDLLWELCQMQPSAEDMREHIDADWTFERLRP